MSCHTLSLSNVANMPQYGYINRALSKISKLAVEGYKFSLGVQSARAFFVRKISMHSYFMAELERDTFECTGNLVSLSSNPFQFCHHHLEVIGKTPINTLGGNHHA
ncbi:MAG: hypothetical protein KA474_07540 [Acinetobacter sp.]|nr:hypothetical protein [Acinetobacter sp.]